MHSILNFLATLFWLAFWLAAAFIALTIFGYNRLRRLSEAVKETFHNISASQRAKVALCNQFTDWVRGYQESEKFTVLKISDDQSVRSLERSNQDVAAVMAQVGAVAQRFPDLKASGQYRQAMESFERSEVALEAARARYNAAVKEYNVARTSIPQVFFAGVVGFRRAEFLDLEARELADAGTQRPLVSDDGERITELMGKARRRALSAVEAASSQARAWAERASAREPVPPPERGELPPSGGNPPG